MQEFEAAVGSVRSGGHSRNDESFVSTAVIASRASFFHDGWRPVESQEGVREYKITRYPTWPPRPHVALDTCQVFFPTMKLYNRENVSAHVLMPAGIETVGGVAHAAKIF